MVRSPLTLAIILQAVLWSPLAYSSREIHVRGDASASKEDGTQENPYLSITKAARTAQPGDTVRVHPIEGGYREMVDLYHIKSGEPGKPITFDGQGCLLRGSDPLSVDGWDFDQQTGLYKRGDIAPRLFLIINGTMVFETYARDVLEEGEFAYVGKLHNRLYFHPKKDAIPTVSVTLASGTEIQIAPSEWQIAEGPRKEIRRRPDLEQVREVRINGQVIPMIPTHPRLKPGQWCEEEGIVYFRPPEGKTPADLHMEACVRANGIQIGGHTSHLVIKNFNAQYFFNDGYNIHGRASSLEFYNCNARDMGDEGFSSHSETDTLLDGAVYENCDNGIYNVNSGGKSVTRNVVIRAPRSVGFGTSPREHGVEHILENAILIDCPVGLKIGQGTSATNVIILSESPDSKTSVNLDLGGNLSKAAISGAIAVPLRADKPGFFSISETAFNSQRPIHIRSPLPLKEVIRFESCYVASGLDLELGMKHPWTAMPALEAISTTGKDNQQFPAMTTKEFLQALRNGQVSGPSQELILKATNLLEQAPEQSTPSKGL